MLKTLFKVMIGKPLTQDEKEIVGEVSFRHWKISNCWDMKLAMLEIENLFLKREIKFQRDRDFFYSLIER